MVKIGDAIMKVTDAFRMNYGIMGNSHPVLHAHIVPRYMWEPENSVKVYPGIILISLPKRQSLTQTEIKYWWMS